MLFRSLTVMEKVDVLQNAELFREIRTQSLSAVAAVAQEVDFGARELLYSEGEASDALYVLARLGPKRAEEGAYVWQKLMKSGAIVANVEVQMLTPTAFSSVK